MYILPAKIADLDFIVRLEQYFPTNRMIKSNIKRTLARNGKTNLTLIAWSDYDMPMGYIMVLTHAQYPKRSRLYSYCVTPGTYGQGVAERLIEHACQLARNSGRTIMTAEVRVDNFHGIHRLEASGFKAKGSQDRYYKDGGAAWFYERALT